MNIDKVKELMSSIQQQNEALLNAIEQMAQDDIKNTPIIDSQMHNSDEGRSIKEVKLEMTPQEAIETIKINYPPENYSMLREALDMAITLLEKQEPKPMYEVEDDDLYAWSPKDVSCYCPNPECEKEISYDYNFCPYCGQAVMLK